MWDTRCADRCPDGELAVSNAGTIAMVAPTGTARSYAIVSKIAR